MSTAAITDVQQSGLERPGVEDAYVALVNAFDPRTQFRHHRARHETVQRDDSHARPRPRRREHLLLRHAAGTWTTAWSTTAPASWTVDEPIRADLALGSAGTNAPGSSCAGPRQTRSAPSWMPRKVRVS